MNVVDDQLRAGGESGTIGLLLCRNGSDGVVRYTLSGVATPMAVAGYTLADLPKRRSVGPSRLSVCSSMPRAATDNGTQGEE